jgi:WHG domain-containing protein
VDALTSLQGQRIVRGDDILLMARFVWAVVHGVAMLAIDGQLPEADAIEKLMRYAIKRLQSGIEADGKASARTS